MLGEKLFPRVVVYQPAHAMEDPLRGGWASDREEQLDEREIAGDLGSWLVRTGKATAADAHRLWAAERIVATAPDPQPGSDGEVEEIQESILD